MTVIQTMNKKAFFAEVRERLYPRRMPQSAVENIEAILACWDRYYPNADVRWVAYSLGTVYHECTTKMTPLREYGRGAGRRYGAPTGKWKKVYYGRGYVQLTWIENYLKAGEKLRKMGVLKPDEDLARTPDLALRPDVAAAILVVGMVEGWFTTKSCATYFNRRTSDWTNARRIINGVDRAALVASYGIAFYYAFERAGAVKFAA